MFMIGKKNEKKKSSHFGGCNAKNSRIKECENFLSLSLCCFYCCYCRRREASKQNGFGGANFNLSSWTPATSAAVAAADVTKA